MVSVGVTRQFFVRATDLGNPPLRSEIPVQLTVGRPDYPLPSFSQSAYAFILDDTSSLDDIVGHVTVNIPKTIPSLRIVPEYVIQPPANVKGTVPFAIDRKSGTLTLSALLGANRPDSYSFYVTATLNYIADVKQSLKIMVPVRVAVRNARDVAPWFMARYEHVVLPENVPISTKVAKIEVNEGLARLEYLLFDSKNNSVEEPFAVDSDGWVTTTRVIDREVMSAYNLTMVARAQGGTVMSPLKVKVQDLNDVAPRFNGPMRVEVPEDSEVGTQIMHVVAEDADAPPFNLVRYYLTGGNEHGETNFVLSGNFFLFFFHSLFISLYVVFFHSHASWDYTHFF